MHVHYNSGANTSNVHNSSVNSERENYFRLNQRVFPNNNVKSHYVLSQFCEVVCIHTLGEVDNFLCRTVKHLSLMLCANFDGNLLTFKVTKKHMAYFLCKHVVSSHVVTMMNALGIVFD